MLEILNENSLRIMLAKLLWGWEPHSSQRVWLESKAKVKVAACGRRWGKTEAAAIDASTMAIMCEGSVQMIVAPTYDQSRLIFNSIEQLILKYPAIRNITKVTKTPYPKMNIGGSVIMARTADEDGRNLRGHSADRVIVDEAAYVKDSVILEVISPMLADRDGELVMVSTPFGKNHFYRAFLRGQDEENARCASFSFPSWTNPHISRDYIEQQRQELSTRQFGVEYEAQFLDDQSSVFPWEDVNAAVERGSVNTGAYDCVVAGIDWARYSDYTALVAVGISENGCEVVGIDRFNGMGWDAQLRRAAEFLKSHKVCAALTDSTSIGDPLLEQLRGRLWEESTDVAVDGYCFTNSSKRELIEHLALKFSHGTISIPRNEQLISELQYFEYELTQSGNVRMNARTGYNDDLVIALALASWQAKGLGTAGRFWTGSGRAAAVGWQ